MGVLHYHMIKRTLKAHATIKHITFRGRSRNFKEGFPYHSQWSSNFTAIFDGNSRLLPSIDLENFYGQLIKNLRWRGFLGIPETPLKPPLTFILDLS